MTFVKSLSIIVLFSDNDVPRCNNTFHLEEIYILGILGHLQGFTKLALYTLYILFQSVSCKFKIFAKRLFLTKKMANFFAVYSSKERSAESKSARPAEYMNICGSFLPVRHLRKIL